MRHHYVNLDCLPTIHDTGRLPRCRHSGQSAFYYLSFLYSPKFLLLVHPDFSCSNHSKVPQPRIYEKFEDISYDQLSKPDHTDTSNGKNGKDDTSGKSRVFIPLVTLISCLFIGMYFNGVNETAWPVTFLKIKQAFGDAQSNLVLLYSSVIACIVAYLFNRNPISASNLSSAKEFCKGISRFSLLAWYSLLHGS